MRQAGVIDERVHKVAFHTTYKLDDMINLTQSQLFLLSLLLLDSVKLKITDILTVNEDCLQRAKKNLSSCLV